MGWIELAAQRLERQSGVADVSINTVTKLLEDVGAACSEFQDKAMRDLTIKQASAG